MLELGQEFTYILKTFEKKETEEMPMFYFTNLNFVLKIPFFFLDALAFSVSI